MVKSKGNIGHQGSFACNGIHFALLNCLFKTICRNWKWPDLVSLPFFIGNSSVIFKGIPFFGMLARSQNVERKGMYIKQMLLPMCPLSLLFWCHSFGRGCESFLQLCLWAEFQDPRYICRITKERGHKESNCSVKPVLNFCHILFKLKPIRWDWAIAHTILYTG